MALDYKSSLARYRRYLQVAQQQPLWQASFYVILSLSLVIVLVVTALRPTLVTIAGLLGQIKQEEELEKRMDEKIATIQKAQQAYQEVQARLWRLDEALPAQARWASFADTVLTVASESGVSVEIMTVGPVGGRAKVAQGGETKKVLTPGVEGVEFRVSAKGTYEGVKQFAGTLTQLRRMNIMANSTLDRENDGQIRLVLGGVFGFMPEEEKQ